MRRKRNTKKAGPVRVPLIFPLLFVLFLGVFDYPFVARLYNERFQDQAAVAYQAAWEATPEDELEKMRRDAQDYNRRLSSGIELPLSEAFAEESEGNQKSSDEEAEEPQKTIEELQESEELHREYKDLLNMGDTTVMGRIRIPKIDVDLPIYHGTSEEVLQEGAGHLEGSSLPVGGAGTHTCLSAHRGLAGKKLFTNLDEMEEGDLFFITSAGETLCYQVREIRTVLPEETKDLTIEEGKDLATLITCTPYGINTHRLCVKGERIPYTEKAREMAEEQEESTRLVRFLRDWGWAGISLVLLAVMTGLTIRYRKRQSV